MSPPLRRFVKTVFWAALLAGGGAVVGYVGASALGPALEGLLPHDPGPWVLFGLLAALPAAVLVAIAVHELGHALAGAAAGLEFRFLTAGPLWVERREGRLGLRFNPIPAAWGGLALCTPPPGADLAAFGPYFLGGPLASLGLAALAAPAAWLAAHLLGPGVLSAALVLLAAVSSAIFVATALLPSSSSDGSRYRALRRGDAVGRAEAAMLVLTGLACSGVRPREWPAELVAAAVDLERREARAAAELYAAQFDWDRGARSEALARLRALAAEGEDLSALLRPSVAVELAIASGFLERDPAELERGLERARGPLVAAHRVELARALAARAAGHEDAACEALARARAAVGRARLPVGPLEREQLDELAQALGAAGAGTRPAGADAPLSPGTGSTPGTARPRPGRP